MTAEEELIQRYFDAFNNHDIEGVMACFHEYPVMVDATGTRFEGREEVRRHYETGFALMPDCRCDLRMLTGHSGRVAEIVFPWHSTTIRQGDRGHWRGGTRNRRWPDKGNPRLPPTAFCKSGIANIFRSSAQGDGACNPTFPLANLRSARRRPSRSWPI